MKANEENKRARLAQALRDFAEWIEEHDEMPVPLVRVGGWVEGKTVEEKTRHMVAFLAAYPHAIASGSEFPDGKRLIGLNADGTCHEISYSVTCSEEDIAPGFFKRHFAKCFSESGVDSNMPAAVEAQ